MNFPKTLVFLVALNLTMATEIACAATAVPSPTVASTPPITVAPAAEDIRDIHGPISIPYGWLWAAYVAGGIALAAAAYGGWRWYRAHRAERAKRPDEIALERLEKARALMTPEQAREYSFAVSEITRRYIEARFHQRAARRTTEEFLHDLLAQSDTPLVAHRSLLEDFLQHCDLAKFARWHLSVPEMESMHESARAFILETRADSTALTPRVPEEQLTHS